VLESIVVAPITATIDRGLEKQFTATGIYTDGSMQDMTSLVVWSSSNTAVALFNNTAGRQGIAVATYYGGTTLITANMSGITSNKAVLTVP